MVKVLFDLFTYKNCPGQIIVLKSHNNEHLFNKRPTLALTDLQ